MSEFKQKLRLFLVRSARDVAAQALPNWAQMAMALGQNFHDVFIAIPQAEQVGLTEAAEQVTASEWASIRGQVAEELGERYAEALDQARQALRGARGARGGQAEALRLGLESSMQVQLRRSARRLSPGVAVSVLMGSGRGSAPPRSAWPTVPGFELTGWLGEGASGKVFVARREGTGELGARVALKVGPLTDRGRFEREVSLMERLGSPHLLSSYSHGVIEGFVPLYWIEMPLMGGQTLAEVQRGDLEETLQLCVGVWRGLEALHQAQVAHRDLKPSNVLLTTEGVPMLGDFGLSKSLGGADASLTETGMAFGSPAYMAPEAIQGQRVGLSADVWSFGVMLCELLSGRLPFKGDVAGVVWASVLRDEPDVTGVADWLQGAVQACLAKDVSSRPADAMALRSLFVEPVERFLERRAREREAETQREARIEALRAQVMSDEDAQVRARGLFIEGIRPLSHDQIGAQWERLNERFHSALKAALDEQKAHRRELIMLEAQAMGIDLPDGLVRLEQLLTPITRTNVESYEEQVPEEVSEGSSLGFGKQTRKVMKTVNRTRDHQVKEHLSYKIEVYAVAGVEFKLVQFPERGFAIGQTLVTQIQYESVMGSNPSHFKGAQKPVENVSWEDGIKFANALSKKLGVTPAYVGSNNNSRFNEGANGFRLPFEAEWEFAAQGGQSFEYAGSDQLPLVGWYRGNSGNSTHDVAKLEPNGYGLYDMSGNVWEWCVDDYNNPGSYHPGAVGRVNRGGGWNYLADNCTVAHRRRLSPGFRYGSLGLRLSRSLV